MCVLITNKIMNELGYFYTFPTDIKLSIVLSFILNGQVILPIILFILISTFLHLGKEGAYFLIYMIHVRKKMFKDSDGYIKYMGERFKWFNISNNIYTKGVNYNSFERLLNDFDTQKEGNVVDFASVVNTMALSIICVLPMYEMNLKIKITLIILSVLYYIFNTLNLFLLYKIQELRDDFIKLKNDIISNTKISDK